MGWESHAVDLRAVHGDPAKERGETARQSADALVSHRFTDSPADACANRGTLRFFHLTGAQDRTFSLESGFVFAINPSMNVRIVRGVVLAVLLMGAQSAWAGPFRTKIITSSDDPLTLTIAENVYVNVRNFTQEGGSARGTVEVTVNGRTANVLSASQINGTSLAIVPEVINRVNIAGPATITVRPVAGATLVITYRKIRDGAPISGPAPTATPTPTPTPTVAR